MARINPRKEDENSQIPKLAHVLEERSGLVQKESVIDPKTLRKQIAFGFERKSLLTAIRV